MNKTSRIDLAGVFKHRANRVLASFWEKQRLPRFVHEQRFPTHYQTLSTRKNWLSCIQNTLLAFFHTGPTKRIEKKSRRIEKVRRIKIYTGIRVPGRLRLWVGSQKTSPPELFGIFGLLGTLLARGPTYNQWMNLLTNHVTNIFATMAKWTKWHMEEANS